MNNRNIYNTANFFWQGNLTPYEILCIKSFIKNDFYVNLWSYEQIDLNDLEDLENFTIKNAGIIMPKSYINKFTQNSQKNNLSSFTNLFRYKLLNEFGGWWFDTDCICLKNVEEFNSLAKKYPFVIGETPEKLVNGSVMFFKDKIHMKNLIDSVEKKLDYQSVNFEWGEIGPYLLTDYFKNKKTNYICSKNLFYEIGPKEFDILFSTNKKVVKSIEVRLGDAFVCHLWNEMYRRYLLDKYKLPPKGSKLNSWFKTYGIFPSKKYTPFVNLRFYQPLSYLFKVISRIKVLIKNISS